MTPADNERLDQHGERLATLENETKSTRRSLDDLKSGQRRIFEKLDEMNQTCASRPPLCAASCRKSIIEATSSLDTKIDKIGRNTWKLLALLVATPAAITALVLLGKALLAAP